MRCLAGASTTPFSLRFVQLQDQFRLKSDGIPMRCCGWARFLQRGLDFRKRNIQGHTALHKAAFSGHEGFCHWLVETVGLLDSQPDESGNYAADLAEMGESLHNTC